MERKAKQNPSIVIESIVINNNFLEAEEKPLRNSIGSKLTNVVLKIISASIKLFIRIIIEYIILKS